MRQRGQDFMDKRGCRGVQEGAAVHWLGIWTRAISHQPARFRHMGTVAAAVGAMLRKGDA
jgi:hypothetical protein